MPLSSDNIKAIFDALEDDEDKADYTGSELNTLEVFDAGDDVDLPPPRGLLLGGNQFARGFLSSLIAPGAVGKTSLRNAQFVSLASGRALTGQHIFRRCRVLMLSLEDGVVEIRRRILACRLHHRVELDEIKDWLFYAAPKGLRLAELHRGSIKIGSLRDQLRIQIEKLQPDIVSLDPLVKAHSLDENNNGQMDFLGDLLASLAEDYDIAVEVPHHARNGLTSPGDVDSGRGASAIANAARLVFTLTQMSEDEAKLFGIDPIDRRQYLRLDNAKVNIARPSLKATWFKLVSINLDNRTDEYPYGDEVQTVEPWSPPELWKNVSSVTLNAILTEIDAGLPDGQRYSDSATAGDDKAAWRVVQKHCHDHTEGQCREIIKAWVKNGLLVSETYYNKVERKDRKGLRVDNTKRPT
jgi:hypothetical protein